MEYTQLQKWINDNKSVNKISELSGMSCGTVRYWLKKYDLKTNFLNFREMRKRKRQYSESEVLDAVKNATCYSDVFKNLNITLNGGSYKWIKGLISSYNVDTSHFMKDNYRFIKAGIEASQKYQEAVYNTGDISNGQRASSRKLQKFLEFHKIEHKCKICSLDSWMGKPIRLDVDHIDGNCVNNKIENLQFICPNCHRQKTLEYNEKDANRKGWDYKIKTCDCGSPMVNGSEQCWTCYNKNKIGKFCKIQWPSNEELQKLVFEKALTTISIDIGVTANAIKKHCNKRNIVLPNIRYRSLMSRGRLEDCQKIKDELLK